LAKKPRGAHRGVRAQPRNGALALRWPAAIRTSGAVVDVRTMGATGTDRSPQHPQDRRNIAIFVTGLTLYADGADRTPYWSATTPRVGPCSATGGAHPRDVIATLVVGPANRRAVVEKPDRKNAPSTSPIISGTILRDTVASTNPLGTFEGAGKHPGRAYRRFVWWILARSLERRSPNGADGPITRRGTSGRWRGKFHFFFPPDRARRLAVRQIKGRLPRGDRTEGGRSDGTVTGCRGTFR